MMGRFRTGQAWRCGSRHQVCQDAIRILVHGKRAAVSVCDGVSSGAGGAQASDAAASHLVAMPDKLRSDAHGCRAWVALTEAVVQTALRRVTTARGATTAAAIWCDAGHCRFTWIGDCRIYLLRTGLCRTAWEQLTRDHTFANGGGALPEGCAAHDLERMIGVDAMGPVELGKVWLHTGDKLLLCSDGLHSVLPPDAIRQIAAGAPPAVAAPRLVAAALAAGASDDISVAIVERRGWLGADAWYWLMLATALAWAGWIN